MKGIIYGTRIILGDIFLWIGFEFFGALGRAKRVFYAADRLPDCIAVGNIRSADRVPSKVSFVDLLANLFEIWSLEFSISRSAAKGFEEEK